MFTSKVHTKKVIVVLVALTCAGFLGGCSSSGENLSGQTALSQSASFYTNSTPTPTSMCTKAQASQLVLQIQNQWYPAMRQYELQSTTGWNRETEKLYQIILSTDEKLANLGCSSNKRLVNTKAVWESYGMTDPDWTVKRSWIEGVSRSLSAWSTTAWTSGAASYPVPSAPSRSKSSGSGSSGSSEGCNATDSQISGKFNMFTSMVVENDSDCTVVVSVSVVECPDNVVLGVTTCVGFGNWPEVYRDQITLGPNSTQVIFECDHVCDYVGYRFGEVTLISSS